MGKVQRQRQEEKEVEFPYWVTFSCCSLIKRQLRKKIERLSWVAVAMPGDQVCHASSRNLWARVGTHLEQEMCFAKTKWEAIEFNLTRGSNTSEMHRVETFFLGRGSWYYHLKDGEKQFHPIPEFVVGWEMDRKESPINLSCTDLFSFPFGLLPFPSKEFRSDHLALVHFYYFVCKRVLSRFCLFFLQGKGTSKLVFSL